MKHSLTKNQKQILAASALFVAGSLAVASLITYAIFTASKNDNGTFPGTVGLRSYFQKGTGTKTDPYVIARPSHFYNLTRLQNLGVFSGPTYFSLGYDPAHPNDPYAAESGTDLKFYPDNATSKTSDMISYLDMTAMSSTTKILAIGSEASPFYGVFDGNKKTVKGLKVTSGPDDVGVFGYTYSGSQVNNVCYQDLTIEDDGYNTAIPGLSTLYGETLSDVTTAGSVLTFHGTPNVDLTTSKQNLVTFQKETQAAEPSFTFTVPNLNISGVTYEFRSSSEYVTSASNGDGTYSVSVNRAAADTEAKRCVENNSSFYGTNGGTLSSRLSLVAKIYKDGVSYSRVLETFKLTFTNNLVSATDHEITMRGSIDYVNTADTSDTTYSEYAHGVNIGFLIGHCDGSASSCFVYNGSLLMNTATGSVQHVAQETETGLIGEVGVSLNNEFTPEKEYAAAGDTGVVNFTKMYNDIAGSSKFVSHKNGDTTYYTFSPTDGSGNLFAPYIRTDGSTANNNWGNAVTNAENSLDFAGRQLIQDETGYQRNLGVFKLTSSDYDTKTSPASTFLLGLGEFNVQYSSSNVFREFYYTTAEWADPSTGTQPAAKWGYGTGKDERIQLGTNLPTYYDSSTWSGELERHYNYVFRCPLSSSATSNYFYNSQGFLQSYFSYKLVDKSGGKLVPGTKNFGVFVKDVNMTTQKTSNISVFDSSLKLSAPSSSTIPTFTLNSTVYPVKSINFSIKSAGGANVTVMASSRNGSGGYVGVYDKSVALQNGKAYTPSYAMYLPYTNSVDDFAYFNYDYATGAVDSKATRAVQGEKLFAHTFTLPKGDYFIGSPNDSAYLYYVCAQGQEHEGNIGDEDNVYSELNVISNVDFVDTVPTTANFSDESGTWGRCFLAFMATFTSDSGTMSVNSVAGDGQSITTIQKPDNLSTALIDSEYSYPIVFNGVSYAKRFIVYPAG